MAKVGGWELLLDSAFVVWSKEVCLIHEMPENYQPSLDDAINFYSKSSIPIIQEAVGEALSKGTPFDLELKIITANKRKVWVRAIGKPIYDGPKNKIVGLRGVFQDIDEQKEKELAIKGTLDFIHEQNKRLFNFAQIVSHNLGSHASNLHLTLDLLNAETSPTEIDHLKDNLKKISESLNQTISHLNDIVVIQTETANIKKKVSFEKVFQSTLSTLKAEIEQEKVEIEADFNKNPDIEYIPAYLESILLNLISNAIKYRNPKKQLKIAVSSFMDKGKPVLEVKDNGLGMDLNRYGDKLFGMYKTFHDNPKARGIGLFITKSQVEAMGGKITAESVLGEGSTFKINF